MFNTKPKKTKISFNETSFDMAKEEWKKAGKSTTRDKTGKYQRFPRGDLHDTPEVGEMKKHKKVLSGYNLFMRNELSNTRSGKKDKSKLMREIATKWNNLREEERKQRNKKANVENLSKKKLFDGSEGLEENIQQENITFKGLKNLGNSCWLNSLLQCLFSSNLYREVVSATYDDEACIADMICETLLEMISSMSAVNAHENLYWGLLAKFGWCNGHQQADDEALTLILRFLNEEADKKAREDVYWKVASVISYSRSCT